MLEIIPNWHPMFVHFSVALLTVAAMFMLVSKFAVNWRLEDQWLAAGYWSLWIGTLFTIGTVAAGIYAFNTVKHDDISHEIMLEHRNLALMTLAAYAGLSIWALIGYRAKKEPSLILVLAIVAAVGLLFNTAWHGAELVYRHGLGVMALPNPSAHSHAGGATHSHGEEAGESEHEHAATPEHEHGAEAEAADHDHDHDAAPQETGAEGGGADADGAAAEPAPEPAHDHDAGAAHSHD